MSNSTLSYILVLAANLSFALASILFTEYARKLTPLIMNAFKAWATLIFLVFTILIFEKFQAVKLLHIAPVMIGGFIGLNIGDMFILRAFAKIGASRTLILFGFHPIIMAISAYFIFSQAITINHIIAISIFLLCLFIFSYETFKETGQWEISGLAMALVGVCLDAAAILLSRLSFDKIDYLTPAQGHFYRTLGAVIGFILIHLFIKKIPLIKIFRAQKLKDKSLLTISAFCGTFISLLFYLYAVKIGHLASISAIAITGPIFATIFECIHQKKMPSKYLWPALALFIIGFSVLFFI
ncbi:MAG: drug/metabolite transporter (DMT)-like permease [Thermoproteota archaeon]|jgi:drug/metabolite transporter (DMT)-like permease